VFGKPFDKSIQKIIKVLPPRRLLLPVLPAHVNGKLIFALCARCTRKEAKTFCSCTDKQRTLHGTWATAELSLALEYDYVITAVQEVSTCFVVKTRIKVLHWDSWSEYDPETGEHGLLSKYQNMAVKSKVVRCYLNRDK